LIQLQAAGGTLGGLMVDDTYELISCRASNDEQYNPDI
jgi:hypothetical protein